MKRNWRSKMRDKILLVLLVFSVILAVQAQKKKDLLLKVSELQTELAATKSSLADSQREAAQYKAQIESVNFQLDELRATNASLMQNLNNFTELSNKKTDNIGKTLESLRAKENQLKAVKDELTHTDSLTLALLTAFKSGLGTDAKAGLSNGAVTIVLENTFLFSDVDKNFTVEESALPVLGKVAAILKQYPQLNILVETNSNALEFKQLKLKDNWDLSALQAAAVVRELTEKYEIAPKRIQAIGKSEYGFDGIETTTRIKVQPPYEAFYRSIKEMMK